METAVFGPLSVILATQPNQYSDEHYEARKLDCSPEVYDHITKYKKLASWDYYDVKHAANVPDHAVQTEHFWAAWWHHPIAGTFDLTVALFTAPADGYRVRLKLRVCEGEDALDNDEYQRHGSDFNVLNIELPAPISDSYSAINDALEFLFLYLSKYDPSTYFENIEE